MRAPLVSTLILGLTTVIGAQRPASIEILKPVFAVPAHVVNRFANPVAYAAARSGEYVVLDTREHTVSAVDIATGTVRPIVELGFEPGRVLRPTAMALAGDDIIAVADAPFNYERLQYFGVDGLRIGGFYLPLSSGAQLNVSGQTIGGLGALAFNGRTFYLNRPDWGTLLSELDTQGRTLRQIGQPRTSSVTTDPDVLAIMNTGIPVVDPTGGVFFVFQAGVPMFRKYDGQGRLVFERHIEGVELDGRIQTLPTVWPTRPPDTKPFLVPLVRAAAADRQGRLWISLSVPYTYVYDGRGEKVRTVQFQTTGPIAPTSLFFTPRGRLLVASGGYEFSVD